jgi:hypothetical protein
MSGFGTTSPWLFGRLGLVSARGAAMRVSGPPAGDPTVWHDMLLSPPVDGVWSSVVDSSHRYLAGGGTASPSLTAARFGSSPGWVFDGVNDYASGAGMSGLTRSVSAHTVYWLLDVVSVPSTRSTIEYIRTSGMYGRMAVDVSYGAIEKPFILNRRLDGDAPATATSMVSLSTGVQVVALVTDYAKQVQMLYVDGVENVSGTTPSAGLTSDTDESSRVLAATNASSNFFPMAIGCRMEYRNQAHAAPMVLAMSRFIRARYGV